MKKILISAICIIVIFSTLCTNVTAAAIDDSTAIQPRYTYINDISVSLTITSGTAKYSIIVTTYADLVERVTVTAYLQYRDADSSDSWTPCKTSYGAGGPVYSFYDTATAQSGYEYRVKAVVTAVTSSYPETVTVYSEIKP